MRFRHLQPIADSQTDSHQGDLWQLSRRPSLGSLGRLVLPPSEGHAITTDEPRHRCLAGTESDEQRREILGRMPGGSSRMRSAGRSGALCSRLQDYGIVCTLMAQTGAGRGRTVQAAFAISALNVSVAELGWAATWEGLPRPWLSAWTKRVRRDPRVRIYDPVNDWTLR
jgi:hypothetical protein